MSGIARPGAGDQPTTLVVLRDLLGQRVGLSMLAPLVIIASVLPSCVWVGVNSAVWPWDQAWYGQVSVDLFDVLLASPQKWFSALANAFAIKAPALAWLGEFLVPIGRALGAIDSTLMALPLSASLLTLYVLYRALLSLTGGNTSSALLGTLAVGTTPLFVGISHQYLVEPLQTLAVALFVLIAVNAPHAPRMYTCVHLVAATAFALLVKVSSPLYCLLPGLLACFWVVGANRWRPQGQTSAVARWKWLVSSVVAGLTTLGALVWYGHNLPYVLETVAADRAGPAAELYGTPAPMIQKLPFWINATQKSFFLPAVGALLLAIFLIGVVAYGTRGHKHGDYGFFCLLAALGELLIVLYGFASATPEETRYLLPASIYMGVIVAWALNEIRSRLVSVAVSLALLVQFGVVNAQALGASPVRPELSPWLLAASSGVRENLLVNRIVAETCQPNRYAIVGVEISWFNANTLAYYASKQRAQRGGGDCYYTSLGYATTEADTAWKRVLEFNTLYVVTLDRSRFPYTIDAFNQPNELVVERLRSAQEYVEVPQEGVTEGVLVFRQR